MEGREKVCGWSVSGLIRCISFEQSKRIRCECWLAGCKSSKSRVQVKYGRSSPAQERVRFKRLED